MKRDRFLAGKNMCELYWDQNKAFKLAIFQFGFPGSIGINSLIKFLVENGYYVIAPHFPGTYDSYGSLTPENTFKFYRKIYETISRENVISLKSGKYIKLPLKIEYAFGHSYGCWAILRGSVFLKDLKCIYLFGPAITYAESQFDTNCGFIENGDEHLNMMLRSRPLTHRIKNKKSFLNLYKGHYDDFRNNKSLISNIYGIVGDNDPYFELGKIKLMFPRLLNLYFNKIPKIKLLTVRNGTHSLESLLTSGVKKIINQN